jgi:formate hydrogenlyase subunit 3/multisubunit Na+/H+ antiporter MnhD subunit
MMPLFLLMLSGYALGALGGLVFGRGVLSRGLSALGAVISAGSGLALGVTALASDGLIQFSIPSFLPPTGFALRLDGLGAFFLIVIGLVGASLAVWPYQHPKAATPGCSALPMCCSRSACGVWPITPDLVDVGDVVRLTGQLTEATSPARCALPTGTSP